MAQGVFCLEGEWWNNFKHPTSVEPALTLLKSAEGWRIPYIHRNVGTSEEFTFYIDKWLLRRHDDFPILYLAFHGDSGKLIVGDQRRKNGQVDFDWLEEKLKGRASGRIIYFGSCSTMEIHGNRVQRFLRNTGLVAACGYRTEVNWMESSILDLLVLSHIGRFPRITPDRMQRLDMVARGNVSRLYKKLRFKMVVRSD